MKRLAIVTSALVLAATAGTSFAADDDVALNEPCAAVPGTSVLTVDGADFEEVVPTPVGALNGFETDAARFVVDLTGAPVAASAPLTLVLSFDGIASDYDLVVDGANDMGVESPEVKTVEAGHCQVVDVKTDVFLGLPVDVLTLSTDLGEITVPEDETF